VDGVKEDMKGFLSVPRDAHIHNKLLMKTKTAVDYPRCICEMAFKQACVSDSLTQLLYSNE